MTIYSSSVKSDKADILYCVVRRAHESRRDRLIVEADILRPGARTAESTNTKNIIEEVSYSPHHDLQRPPSRIDDIAQ